MIIQMDIIETIISILALLTNIFLWIVTRNTLVEVKRQNDKQARSIESESISKITASHQTILINLLNDSHSDSLLNGFSKDGSKKRESVYGSLLINHFYMIYSFHDKGFLSKDYWVGLQNDVKDSFDTMEIISSRWKETQAFYPVDFQDFIDSLVRNGRLKQ